MEDAGKIDLIDFSAENDNLIFNLSSPPLSDGKLHLSGNQKEPRSYKVLRDTDAGCGDSSQDNDETEHVPELAQSEEPQILKQNRKCNLRKSLAWDSAFFTSAGVLDPEELSSILMGAAKGYKNVLPGIQEDIRTSSDSISTLESDNLTIENLELELFEDIRASIQKSCKTVKSSSHTALEVAGNKATFSPKVDFASADHLKSKPVARKTTGLQTIGMPKCQPKMSAGMQGSGKSMKPLSAGSQLQKTTSFSGMQGSGNSMKPSESSGSQLPKFVVRTRESKSSVPRPPKENSKVISIASATAKGSSMDTRRAKADDNDNSKTGRGTQTIKASVPSTAHRVPKASSSCKSSLGPSAVPKTQSTRSTLGDNCSNTSERGGKSPVANFRRKVATRVLNPSSSSSVAKTLSTSASKSKATSENSSLSSCLMSSKISPNISPASSISEWSSASSSCSSVNQRSNKSRTSVGSSSCKSLDVDTCSLDPKTDKDNRREDGQEHVGMVLPNKSIRSVVRTGTASYSASMRPSGLRMPSPKIGFFDGVKAVCTPNGTLQSGLPVEVSKKTGGEISREVRKPPPGKISSIPVKVKAAIEKRNSSVSSQEKSQAPTKVDDKVAESYLKSQEVVGEESQCDGDASLGATINQNLGAAPKSDMNLDRNADPWVKDVEVDGTGTAERLDSYLNSLYITNEKENARSGDYVDGLSEHQVDGKAVAQIVEPMRNTELTPTTILETNSDISASRAPLSVKNSGSDYATAQFSNVSAGQVSDKGVANLLPSGPEDV